MKNFLIEFLEHSQEIHLRFIKIITVVSYSLILLIIILEPSIVLINSFIHIPLAITTLLGLNVFMYEKGELQEFNKYIKLGGVKVENNRSA